MPCKGRALDERPGYAEPVVELRWPKKREFLSYYLLLKTHGCDSDVNIGELLDTLGRVRPRRVARNILRRLVKLGFVDKRGVVKYRVKCLEEVLDGYLEEYVSNTTSPRRSQP